MEDFSDGGFPSFVANEICLSLVHEEVVVDWKLELDQRRAVFAVESFLWDDEVKRRFQCQIQRVLQGPSRDANLDAPNRGTHRHAATGEKNRVRLAL